MALPRDTTGLTLDDAQAAFDAAKAAIIAGEKIVSWSSAGSSVSKQPVDSGELMAWAQWLMRELAPEIYGPNRRSVVASYY